MPQFINPFPQYVPSRKMTREELSNAIRQNIAAEHEAVMLYTSHAAATDNKVAQKVLNEVADDEKVHVGNFTRLLEMLTGDEGKYMRQGLEEVDRETQDLRSLPDAIPNWISVNFDPLDPLGTINRALKEVTK